MARLVLMVVFVLASTIGKAAAVEYQVTNKAAGTAGGDRFDREFGIDHSEQVLSDASSFAWATFQQAEGERKSVSRVSMVVEQMNGIAYTSGDEIHVSAGCIEGIQGDDLKAQVEGVLYHEVAHVWQWNGNGAAVPGGLIEGVADFVRLKAGYIGGNWGPPGDGDKWDQGYDVTARFLDYCDGTLGGGHFVADLNRAMRDGYSDGLFVQLLGKTVDELWSQYKAAYGH